MRRRGGSPEWTVDTSQAGKALNCPPPKTFTHTHTHTYILYIYTHTDRHTDIHTYIHLHTPYTPLPMMTANDVTLTIPRVDMQINMCNDQAVHPL